MKIILIGLCLFVCSCQGYYDSTVDEIKNIIYFKDKRTNLCFAAMYLGSQYGILTNVPCSTEVESLIIQNENINENSCKKK